MLSGRTRRSSTSSPGAPHKITECFIENITIEDIGTDVIKNELMNNPGTIAKSGTKAITETSVVSKNTDDEQYIWKFAVDATFKAQKQVR